MRRGLKSCLGNTRKDNRLYMEKINAFFKGIWQFVSYLFVPQSGSKRRAEQQAYGERLDEAMKRVQAEKDC